jgi:hypothetical protein
MRSLTLTFAAVAIASGILAPAGLAKKKHCPPGSDAPEYCQHDPGGHRGDGDGRGEGEHGSGRHHRKHRRSVRHDDVVVPAGYVAGERARQ